jgi:hypothetical protein
VGEGGGTGQGSTADSQFNIGAEDRATYGARQIRYIPRRDGRRTCRCCCWSLSKGRVWGKSNPDHSPQAPHSQRKRRRARAGPRTRPLGIPHCTPREPTHNTVARAETNGTAGRGAEDLGEFWPVLKGRAKSKFKNWNFSLASRMLGCLCRCWPTSQGVAGSLTY